LEGVGGDKNLLIVELLDSGVICGRDTKHQLFKNRDGRDALDDIRTYAAQTYIHN
jgi:hypothetical protein